MKKKKHHPRDAIILSTNIIYHTSAHPARNEKGGKGKGK